jgi:hypothetical protein
MVHRKISFSFSLRPKNLRSLSGLRVYPKIQHLLLFFHLGLNSLAGPGPVPGISMLIDAVEGSW